jgi:LPS sulfotransferase NodH
MEETKPAIIPIRPARRRRLNAAELWLECRRSWHRLHLLQHWWLKRHTPYQAFFVLATHRSGSNLLIDYLSRLADVQCHCEILCPVFPDGPRYSLQTLHAPIRGCKLMLDQLADYRLTLDHLDACFPNAKYLILYRQSLVEQYLSWRAARSTNQWVMFKERGSADGPVFHGAAKAGDQRAARAEPRQVRVSIDPSELRAYCEKTRGAYREILRHAGLSQRVVLLSYEELTSNPGRCLGELICPLLGVPPIEPQTCLRKQNTLPLAERIVNYSEVAALVGSPLCQQRYAWPWRQQVARVAA